jgi:Ca2+-binding EF-hand superfamily protein
LTNEDFIKLEFTAHHIESILRRCDHDGDAELNYEEFLEIIEGI